MRYFSIAARVVFGLIFFASGLVGLLNLVPPPPNLPEKLLAFMNGMMAAGYLFPLVKGTETICGLLCLVSNCARSADQPISAGGAFLFPDCASS